MVEPVQSTCWLRKVSLQMEDDEAFYSNEASLRSFISILARSALLMYLGLFFCGASLAFALLALALRIWLPFLRRFIVWSSMFSG